MAPIVGEIAIIAEVVEALIGLGVLVIRRVIRRRRARSHAGSVQGEVPLPAPVPLAGTQDVEGTVYAGES